MKARSPSLVPALGAFSRGFASTLAILHTTSRFASAVGARDYPRLYFASSALSVLLYLVLAKISRKATRRFYLGLLFATTAAGLLHFFHEASVVTLIAFAVAATLVDILGPSVSVADLNALASPAIFRVLVRRVLGAELSARVLGSLTVGWLERHHTGPLLDLLWLAAISLHILFRLLPSGLPPEDATPRPTPHFRESFSFLISNPLVRSSVLLSAWAQVGKFLVEYVHYLTASQNFPSPASLASYLSLITTASLLVGLVSQNTWAPRLIARANLSFLFGILPVGLLVLNSLYLGWPGVPTAALLFIFFQSLHRAIQLPVSRQCLIPVPLALRDSTLFTVSLVLSTANLAVSGAMSVWKETFAEQETALTLLLLTFPLFPLLSQLDVHYVRNLWRTYRERTSGSWADALLGDTALPLAAETRTLAVAEEPHAEESHPTRGAELKATRILQTYSLSHDAAQLARATLHHRELLRAPAAEAVFGVRALAATRMPHLLSVLRRLAAGDSIPLRTVATEALEIEAQLQRMGIDRLLPTTRLALQKYFRADPQGLDALQTLQSLPEMRPFNAAVAALVRLPRGHGAWVLECFPERRLSLGPFFVRLGELSLNDSQIERDFLADLGRAAVGPQAREWIRMTLREFLLAHSSEPLGENKLPSQMLQALHMEEWLERADRGGGTVTYSLRDIEKLSAAERGVWNEIHFELIKGSPFVKAWAQILAREPADDRRRASALRSLSA